MYKTSSDIKTELNEVNSRLQELIQLQMNQRSELIKLQSGLTTGINSIGEVESAKSQLATLETAVSSLKFKQTELQKSYEAMSKAENRSIQLKKAKPLMLEIEKSYHEYVETALELNKTVGELGNKMVSALYQVINKHNELANLLPNEPLEIAARELGLSRQTINTILSPRPNNVSLEFSGLVKLIENFFLTNDSN